MRRWIASSWLAVGICAAALQTAGNVGFVVDNMSGQVWVVDLARKQVDHTIPTGSSPAEMLILPNNLLGFVSNHDSDTVSVLDLRSGGSLLETIQLRTASGPASLSCTPDGLYVYVANDTDNSVSIISTTMLSVVATIPVGDTPIQVNVDPSGRFAYVVNQFENTISVIDTSRYKVVKTIPTGSQPNQFAILPNLNTAYVVNKGSNDLTTIDLSQNEATGRIPVGLAPVSVAYSSDSRRLYVVNSGSASVSVVDTSTNQRISPDIPAGPQPAAMVLTFDSKYGYVSNGGANTVSLLDLTARTKDLDITVGVAPFSLMLDPNEDFLYVASIGSGGTPGRLTVIDVNRDQVIANISAGSANAPVQFTMLNAPTLLEIAPNPAPSGSTVILGGEGFVQGSKVRVDSPGLTRTVVTPVTRDSQGLEVDLPAFTGASATLDVVNPDGSSSEQITLRSGTALSAISPGGVVEAAGFARAPSAISGNAIVAIFGNFPGMQSAGANTLPLPRTLGNARVTFNGVPAPLFATIPGGAYPQINALAPVRLLAQDEVRVAVTIGDRTSTVETVDVAPTSPGIFYLPQSAIVHGADQTRLVTDADPAARGETVVMYVGGLGSTTPPPTEGDGAPSDVLAVADLPVKVRVSGVEADTVWFKGLTPTASGLYQINFRVPASLPSVGSVDVTIEIGGRTSNVAKMAVR